MKNIVLLFIALQLACFAAPPDATRQAERLHSLLRQADDAYYNQHHPLMSDAAYDALRDQYNTLLRTYPELAAPNPVGAPADSSGAIIAHTTPVLSLQKAFSDEEVEAFIETCGRDQRYCIEPKIDGLTVVLRYRNGLLAQALTRGDGKTGTDITTAVIASGAVPIALTNAPDLLEVRGEAFLSFAAFDALNQRRTRLGESALKSPRNTAAGTLKLSDCAEITARRLSIQLFELVATDPMPATHTDAIDLIRRVGLPAIESRTVSGERAAEAVRALLSQPLPFPTDGVVIKLDNRALYEQLGSTAHHPRGALARKTKDVPVETTLRRVEWSRADSGKITPVAWFDPVELHGATLQKASLHTRDHLQAMDLKLGDTILVIRAGGTIPEIIGRSPGQRTGIERPIPFPDK